VDWKTVCGVNFARGRFVRIVGGEGMLRNWLLVVLAAGITGTDAQVSSVRQAVNAKVTQAYKADLNCDGSSETVAITYRAKKDGHLMGGDVIVLGKEKDRLVVKWRHRNLNPWKLRIADVDGDGKKEIAVGVWKKSPKDPVMARRVFFYNWDGERMTPKWLGSRLSRRFEDFEVRDINKDGWDELLALEIAPGKPKRVGIYRWKSFGFEWIGSDTPDKWKELTK
jgi:hypothetical protein